MTDKFLSEVTDDDLEIARKAIEDTLIEWRDERLSEVLRNNGLVIKEANGNDSSIIRFGPETAVRIGIKAIIEAKWASGAADDQRIDGSEPTVTERTDLGDGHCTNHPDACMIPGCDHTIEPQRSLDRKRFRNGGEGSGADDNGV